MINTPEYLAYITMCIENGETDIERIKHETAEKFSLKEIPKNTVIYAHLKKIKSKFLHLLKRKPMRTLSGVTPIAVMIKPENSCNWQCIYCPFTGRAAKSYTGDEPAARRGRDNDFNPYRQVKARLCQFEINGHPTQKCDVIVMGGTFLETPEKYRRFFIKNIYDALNNKKSRNIAHAKKINESAEHRAVGLTIETRPDVCSEMQIDEMLYYGATKVELGVQHPDDGIYRATKRGHLTDAVVNATKLLKNAAFKVLYHIMPGLPESNPEKDIEMARRLFTDEKFKPDMLKIYPTLVIPGTVLYEKMKKRVYTPYNSEQAADIISEFYRYIPKYVRVMRIQRDIPAPNIAEGVKKSNLRELVEQKIREKNIIAQEIRYREIGLNKQFFRNKDFELKRLDYTASGGKEVFLSFESEKWIAAFLRLRISSETNRKEMNENSALVRELHVYGEEALLNTAGIVQHAGLGSRLLAEAERIAGEEFGRTKMIVISGVGVRNYYYKRGYQPAGPYVTKNL